MAGTPEGRIESIHEGGATPPNDLDAIAKALEELQLHAPEAHTPKSDQLLGFNYGRLERQRDAFLDPDRPERSCAALLSPSPTP